MVFAGTALPLLFAVPSALRTGRLPHRAGARTRAAPRRPAATATAATVDAVASVADDAGEGGLRATLALSKDAYRDLASPGCFVARASSTVSFQHVRPAAERASTSSGEAADMGEAAVGSADARRALDAMRTSRGDGTRPLLVYLPGLDGVGISAVQQYEELSRTFELWRMRVDPVRDRSTFAALTEAVARFVRDAAAGERERPVVLVGESFGGLLAAAAALRLQAAAQGPDGGTSSPVLRGLVLVNPATSFGRTGWSTAAPLLASLRHLDRDRPGDGGRPAASRRLPTPYSVVGGMALSATVPDPSQLRSILDIVTKEKVTSVDDVRGILSAMGEGFGLLEEHLPAAVIEHRVGQWLSVGCQAVNPRLGTLNVPTLFIGGDEDNMLPTKEEGARLVDVMPNCTSMMVKDAGHFLLDDRFNLTAAIIDAPFDPFDKKTPEKKYDPITDWQAPSDEEIREAASTRVKPLRDLCSPQFFSTGRDGRRAAGLGKVPAPDDGPLLFVANHQLIGLDLGMIISELLEERGIAARGLAHPIVFQGGNGFNGGAGPTGPPERIVTRNKEGRVNAPPGDFQTFGAVMVTPKNFYRLMQTGQAGLLFPGGVREVFHGKGEEYALFWPEKSDFVRVAARFNATVVPISAVGSADSARILLDSEEVLDLPFGLGEQAKNQSESIISARFDQSNSDERFVPPVVVPTVPARHYFVFGQPFDTSTIDHNDRESCARAYADIKSELRRGLDDVLAAREHDPFKDFATRWALERVSGKRAPTFAVDELNKHDPHS